MQKILYHMTEALKRLRRDGDKMVLHRDIKPENILFKLDEKTGNDQQPRYQRFVLTDFGLAKAVN